MSAGDGSNVIPMPGCGDPAVTEALADIPAMLRGWADDLEKAARDGTFRADVAILVLSAPSQRVPSVRVAGRAVSEAEADGLLMHAIMFPAFGLNP